jgi:hypothetical protein
VTLSLKLLELLSQQELLQKLVCTATHTLLLAMS